MEDIAATLKDYFKYKEDILLVFIFGSAVNDRLTRESDIDIAVLFKYIPDFKEIFHLKGDISELIKRETDVVVLNNSSPVIRMQVLRNGVAVVNKDSAAYNDFFVRTVKEYDDLKRVRKETEENILRGKIYA
ncbi:MAG: nucleotidyltransferase domain-containing protein [Nitrospirae bacterium]|nr:nucleotidyltransferase domain-containing protein [Nitrospirota bacterium]MCL5978088.1 nucleotidyltransferase domain-containing protein [Nitrospirota bacterium]